MFKTKTLIFVDYSENLLADGLLTFSMELRFATKLVFNIGTFLNVYHFVHILPPK